MLLTPERAYKTIQHGMNLRFLIVKFTNRCNADCSICIEDSTNNKTDLLSLDLIEKVFKECTNLDIDMGLQGGEVMLYPEYCKEIYDMWRKYNKYKLTHMISNGFWGDNLDLIDYMKNDLKPDLLMLTTDKWHQKFVPLSKINIILDHLKDDPIINVGIFQIVSKKYPLKTPKELGLNYEDIFTLPNRLHYHGRGINIKKENDDVPSMKYYNNEKLGCDNFGLSLHPDGTIGSNCPAEMFGCNFGKIAENNIVDIFENLGRPVIKYTGEAYSLTEKCKELQINPLDEKWKRSNYKLNEGN
jgi:hypothetical protein